jgi:hypothetical protein
LQKKPNTVKRMINDFLKELRFLLSPISVCNYRGIGSRKGAKTTKKKRQ